MCAGVHTAVLSPMALIINALFNAQIDRLCSDL